MARPRYEIIPGIGSRALIYKIDRDLWPVYHFHPEFDILLVLKNRGEFISGDYIGRMGPGTLFMNGPNIPHAVHPGEPEDRDWENPAMVVIQFSPATLGTDLLAREEMEGVRRFLEEEARWGFEFFGETRARARDVMLGMRVLDDFERLLELLRLLKLLSESPERRQLASVGYSPTVREKDIDRMDVILRHIQKHKAEPISLGEMAGMSGMTDKSFCRFFKAHTGKTLIRYVNELRVSEACKLLLESEKPITEICFDIGFNNVANFNRRFRDLKKMSPREFRKQSRIEAADQRRPLPESRVYGSGGA